MFCKRIAAGEQAEEIIPVLFPDQEPGLAFRRLMTNERVAAFLSSIIEARNSRIALLLKMGVILNDAKARNSDKIAAARLSGQILGYLQANATSPRRPIKKHAGDAPSSQEGYLRSLELVNAGRK
jgi:hypothetical protein